MELIYVIQEGIQTVAVFLLGGKEWGLHYYGLGVIVSLMGLRLLIGKPSHAIRVVKSHIVLYRLRWIDEPAKQFQLLRNLNPFTFEEVILTGLKKHGFRIKRNKRYTGDGGIDGQCWWKGQRYLIQAKRYHGRIKTQDVDALKLLCMKKKTKGFFVHTGSTPTGAHRVAGEVIQIVSGKRLLELLGCKDAGE